MKKDIVLNESVLPEDISAIMARQGRYNMQVVNIVPGPEDIARLKSIYANANSDVILGNVDTKIYLSESHKQP